MEELRLYLNSLSLEEQREFATKCGTSIGYLRKHLAVIMNWAQHFVF